MRSALSQESTLRAEDIETSMQELRGSLAEEVSALKNTCEMLNAQIKVGVEEEAAERTKSFGGLEKTISELNQRIVSFTQEIRGELAKEVAGGGTRGASAGVRTDTVVRSWAVSEETRTLVTSKDAVFKTRIDCFESGVQHSIDTLRTELARSQSR